MELYKTISKTPKPSCTFFILAQIIPVSFSIKKTSRTSAFSYPLADIRFILHIQEIK